MTAAAVLSRSRRPLPSSHRSPRTKHRFPQAKQHVDTPELRGSGTTGHTEVEAAHQHRTGHDQRDADRPGTVLALAEREFERLMNSPRPLALDGEQIGHGLPERVVELAELREWLLSPQASDALKDATWKELLRQARGADSAQDGALSPDWVTGCIGMALPGLRSIARRATRSVPPHAAEDIGSEIITEFVARLARIDIDRPHIVERLLLWVRKGAFRARARNDRQVPHDPARVAELADTSTGSAPSRVEPVALLDEAVRQGVISQDARELIQATRLAGKSLRQYAQKSGEAETKLYSRRARAEERLADAIREGQVSTFSVGQGA